MSGSYLPNKNGPHSEFEPERGPSMPARHTGGVGYSEYTHYQDAAPGGQREQVEKVVDLIFRRKWIVLVSFLAVLAGTAAYTMTLIPQYLSTSYVLIDLGQVTLDVGRTGASGFDPSETSFSLFARSDRTIQSEIRMLQISDQLAQRVYRRLQEKAAGVTARPDSVADSSRVEVVLPPVSLNGGVQFQRDRDSDDVLRITGSSSDAAQAALLANLYAEEYVRLTQEASRSYASGLRKTLEEQERETRNELLSLEDRIQRYKIEEGGAGLGTDATRLLQQITGLEVQRDDARITLRVEQASLQSLERELETINPQLARQIASDVQQRLQALHASLATERDNMEVILLENPELRNRPDVDVLQPYNKRIRNLEAQIDSLSRQYVEEQTAAGGGDGLAHAANLRRQIAEKNVLISEMEARMEAMDSRLRGYEGQLKNIPSQSMQLTQLERARMQAEQMYQTVGQKLQEARTAEESEPGYARLLRAAGVPGSPVYPDPRRNMILGAFFGLLVGLVLAIVRDKLDNRIYKPDHLREQGWKEIGVIPNMEPLIKQDYHGQPFLEQDGQRFATSLVTLINPIAAVTEAYRHVRTNIQFNHPEADIQTLLVASPSVSEGKSTTAANLAIVMAQAGRRTLLIDADLRRPQQHRIFGLQRDAGLVEALSNGAHYETKPWQTYVDNLYVLTAGRKHLDGTSSIEVSDVDAEGRIGFIANPAELLGSNQMYTFLEAMREQFDMIIIDSPPVLAATDAALLSTQCDAAIIVARAGKTKEGELKFALETFNDVGAPILGVLLNAFDLSMAYGHKYRYQHYTRYGRYSKYGYYGYRSDT